MLLALQEIIFVNAFTKVNNMFTTFHISYTFRLGTLTLIFTFTVENTSMNPKYFIHMYWTNFCRLTVNFYENTFEKLRRKICSPNIYASFGTFCVKIGQLFESQWAFQECLNIDKSLFSKENVADFRRMFKDSLRLETLTNLDAKGAKRSVKM